MQRKIGKPRLCVNQWLRKKNIKMYTAFKVHDQKPLKCIRRSPRNASDLKMKAGLKSNKHIIWVSHPLSRCLGSYREINSVSVWWRWRENLPWREKTAWSTIDRGCCCATWRDERIKIHSKYKINYSVSERSEGVPASELNPFSSQSNFIMRIEWKMVINTVGLDTIMCLLWKLVCDDSEGEGEKKA